MNIEILLQNWGLAVAGVLVLIVAVIVVTTVVRRSAGGQLRRSIAELETRNRARVQAHKAAENVEKKLARLKARADKIKPRVIEELKGLLSDKRALTKIADDQLMIAQNHVRRVIHDEFPPAKHDELRTRYLPDDIKDKRPFSF